jgi:hypothetical protein
MVRYVHLFVLQIHSSSFKTGWWEEMVLHREAFHGLGVQDVSEFNSVLCFLGERIKRGRKRERGRNDQGSFFPGPDMSCWLCYVQFSWLLGAIKG